MNAPRQPYCPCGGICHHSTHPCSLGCWAAQKPWRVEEAVASARAAEGAAAPAYRDRIAELETALARARGAYREAAEWITTVQRHYVLGPEASPADIFAVAAEARDESAGYDTPAPPAVRDREPDESQLRKRLVCPYDGLAHDPAGPVGELRPAVGRCEKCGYWPVPMNDDDPAALPPGYPVFRSSGDPWDRIDMDRLELAIAAVGQSYMEQVREWEPGWMASRINREYRRLSGEPVDPAVRWPQPAGSEWAHGTRCDNEPHIGQTCHEHMAAAVREPVDPEPRAECHGRHVWMTSVNARKLIGFDEDGATYGPEVVTGRKCLSCGVSRLAADPEPTEAGTDG